MESHNDPIKSAIAAMIAPFFFSVLGTGIWLAGNTLVKSTVNSGDYLASTLLGGAVTSWQRGRGETNIAADRVGNIKSDNV